MEAKCVDASAAEQARSFWSKEDVDQVFSSVLSYLDHLKKALKSNTATDKELAASWKLLECLDWSSGAPAAMQDASVVQVVIGSVEFSRRSPPPPSTNGLSGSAAPPAGKDELLPPLSTVQLQYHQHCCCRSCLPSLPSMPQSTPPFWGQNPFRVPLLCGFKRLTAAQMTSPRGGEEEEEDEEEEEEGEDDVIYKAPCGQSLRNYDDVMRFLLATESYGVLQVDFFSFNPSVRFDVPVATGPRHPELDLSRGLEPTPVELCAGDSGARPADFRYRKDRWPHGCFLSRGPTLFSTCCDCTDGCSDTKRCACMARTRGGRHYSHHRLMEPVTSGVYECGPWCGCDRALCQNRLVQRGIRVRLQVFQTEGRGWGVRCRDDLDHGTFVCIYAGVILQRVQSADDLAPPKLMRSDLPSDDDVEVVTEWLAPPVLEGRSDLEAPPPKTPPTSPPLHVPVIQRPADAASTQQDRDKSQAASPSGDQRPRPQETVTMTTGSRLVTMTTGSRLETLRKRKMKMEDVYLLDASKEGNVSRFFNHSCDPNLFVQNVFTDSHDPSFPLIAFFTSRVVKAGTELTWDYSSHPQSVSSHRQEVRCVCGGDECRGQFSVEEKVCDVCVCGGGGEGDRMFLFCL
ncbi:histone-lysine N-methyltransferase SETDB2 [Scomber japonicus]|uniref:histone-lysine N-methyltransferase SETDB2 n=1 Tax=Scomber japonicus TaxID=13676 RepID=UPI00230620A8|nr:histone-lysine N-methyltransferase SETDB2 [Scomber japonicus]